MYNYEPLDYLSPTVKRSQSEASNSPTKSTGAHNGSDKANNSYAHDPESLRVHFQRSSSLIVQKITEKLLREQYSILNLIKHQAFKGQSSTKGKNQKCQIPKNKPVIKITVVPTTTATQTSKTFFKRKRKVYRTIQETVSNTDCKQGHFRTSQNRQYTHDIKESSSADLYKLTKCKKQQKYEEVSLRRISHTNQILDSIEMEHKRRKDKSWVSNDIQISPRSVRKVNTEEQGCTCNNSVVNNVLDDMNSRKNRVTIVGRLGLNENDQYVLNCAATVGNKPIETHVTQGNIRPDSSSQIEHENGNNRSVKGTQANSTVFALTKNAKTNNKTVQCNCNNTATDVATTTSNGEFVKSTERKSPLIVISVYPTKETMEDFKCIGDLIQINQFQDSPHYENTKPTEYRQKKTKSNTVINKSIARSVKSRSPSPQNKTVRKERVENNIDNRKSPKTIRKESPDRQSRLNKGIPKTDTFNKQPKITNTVRTTKIDPLRCRQGNLNDQGFDKSKIKKAIIDEYTQKCLVPINSKNSAKKADIKPKRNASQVTIDIDGDNEKYRVLFLQDKVKTDLSVRKTLKSQDAKHSAKFKTIGKCCDDNDSMENFLMLKKSAKYGKKSISNDQNHNTFNSLPKNIHVSDKNPATLKIRDSLEINHRREGSYSQHKNINLLSSKHKKSQENNKYFEKHYRGDNCSVSNPAERDQEIRDLLGINKYRSAKYYNLFPEFVDQALQTTTHERAKISLSERLSSSSRESCRVSKNKERNKKPILVTTSTQCDQNTGYSYQQMILNRNIQVFLQVDQLTKQKSILLSQKQYNKVKKSIHKKSSNKIRQERRKCSKNCSVISIGEIRKTKKHQRSNVKINKTVQAKQNSINNQTKEVQEQNTPLVLLYSNEKDSLKDTPRLATSSLEIRYGSTSHLKHVTFSSSKLKSNTTRSLLSDENKDPTPSVETIFKGYKKTVTPNLGTSVYSLSDEEINRYKNGILNLENEKPKKPFLRRLMSCLIMRSGKESEAIMRPAPQRDTNSFMNSFDSYHINTSLAGIDMSSSLYDTSISFFSNHTVLPVANMKRGFLSSVRGFLTNLKGR